MNVGSWSKRGSDFISPKEVNDLVLFDTTLRDGAQTEGLTLSLEDKLSISKQLSDFGVNYIEGGWPHSNETDKKYFSEVRKLSLKSKIAAFGMTSMNPETDPQIKSLVDSCADVIVIFGKTWDLHVKDVLKVSPEDNLKMISGTIKYLQDKGFEVFFDAEHFFDGYKSNPDYAIRVLKASSMASVMVLADTNGGSMPWEVDTITKEVAKRFETPLGIHMHNDSGMAVINSIIAIQNGIRHVQGTVNGLGERCGNMDWCEFIPLVSEKLGIKLKVDVKDIMSLSKYVERMTGFGIARNKPFVGENAFSHKGGIHIDAMIKNPLAYEHMDPSIVGNKRYYGLSELVGRSGIINAAKRHGIHLEKSSPVLAEVIKEVKNGEATTDAELYIILKEKQRLDSEENNDMFELLDYETRIGYSGRSKTVVKVRIGKDSYIENSEGVGPLHSLDIAMRKALEKSYNIDTLQLRNFRVRILNQEKVTAASVEVFLEFSSNGDKWSTSGISDDVIKASEIALIKGYKYYLLKYDFPKSKGETDRKENGE